MNYIRVEILRRILTVLPMSRVWGCHFLSDHLALKPEYASVGKVKVAKLPPQTLSLKIGYFLPLMRKLFVINAGKYIQQFLFLVYIVILRGNNKNYVDKIKNLPIITDSQYFV